MSRQGEQLTAAATPAPRNPLDLRAALLFASIFLAMLVATKLAATHLGHRAASNNLVKGIYAKSFGSRECGNRALTALAILAALGAGAVLFV